MYMNLCLAHRLRHMKVQLVTSSTAAAPTSLKGVFWFSPHIPEAMPQPDLKYPSAQGNDFAISHYLPTSHAEEDVHEF